MDRIGRIVECNEGRARIEVGLHQECVSGSCHDCHAEADGKWIFTVPWTAPHVIGQRVLVRERRVTLRIWQWIAFLAAFCAVLALAQEVSAAVRVADSQAQRAAIVVGIGVAAAAWLSARAWARRQPQFRVEALDAAVAGLPQSGAAAPGAAFVPSQDVRRIDT